jgi:hypothetical protein
MISACRHSKNLASSAMVKRTGSVARLGLFFRSRNKAQLLPQEQILSGERTSGTKPGPKNRQHV